MPILNSLISWIMIKRKNQIDFFKRNPFEVQKGMLFELINTAKNTSFGKQFKFNDINSIKEFQERVPIHDYDTIKPYIEKILNGEQNILWPSEIKWFAKSSGTTSDKSKFIPVSKESLENCHNRGGKDVLAIYSDLNPDARLLRGKGLIIGGSHQINNLSSESYYGDVSAVIIQNMPFWAHLIRTPDISIALMDEWEEKIEKMAHATIQENVTSISGVPSWTLVLIKRIFEITGKSDLMDVWPNLELFVHGGVSFEPYREQFKSIIKSP
ncbi:MAG: GH3 auxin-responsive promoter family protein, partial [Bacteroidales bacterium]|nr:GH3 auxin-responsive promoter family protein [Bacteroidales bacterium]